MFSFFSLWKRLRRHAKDRLWRLRLKLAYQLVGDRSFAANVDIVGTIHLTRMTFGAPMVRDIYVFETAKMRHQYRTYRAACCPSRRSLKPARGRQDNDQ